MFLFPAYVGYSGGDQGSEGPDRNRVNLSATQPVRRFQWWGWLSSIGGYIFGQRLRRRRVCESQHQDYRVAAADIPVKTNFWARLPTWASAV